MGGLALDQVRPASDMTRPKDAAAELIYHAHLIENMEDAVLATDASFVLTAWNQGAQRMLGRQRQSAPARLLRRVTGLTWTAVEALRRRGSNVVRPSTSMS